MISHNYLIYIIYISCKIDNHSKTINTSVYIHPIILKKLPQRSCKANLLQNRQMSDPLHRSRTDSSRINDHKFCATPLPTVASVESARRGFVPCEKHVPNDQTSTGYLRTKMRGSSPFFADGRRAK